MEFLNKAITLSQAQYNGAVFLHRVFGEVLKQASPEDDTPLQLSVMEGLAILGQELMGKQQQ